MQIKVLFVGEHQNHYLEDGTGYDIFPLYSSSTLISGSQKILVDTGDLSQQEKLLSSLEKEKISPDEIDFVILTHFHLDHTANIHLFKKAAIIGFHAIRFPDGRARIFKKFPPDYLPNIKIMETPGHTLDCISVLAGDTICVGDAVRADHLYRKKVPKYRSAELYISSMQQIFNLPGVKRIIPGHGEVIEGKLFQDLKAIVNNLTIKDAY